MDIRTAERLHDRNVRGFARFHGGCAPDSEVWEHEGITASIAPAAPGEEDVNMAAGFAAAPDRSRALRSLTAAYGAAGVTRWGLWVPDLAPDAGAELAAAGYRVSQTLSAVILDLATFDPIPLGDLDYDHGDDVTALAAMNAAVYGRDLTPAFASLPPGTDTRVYRARLDGKVCAVLCTLIHTGDGLPPDCGLAWVATLPAARGKRIASRLVTAALSDARALGCATSSGHSNLGPEPLYRALGFRRHFLMDVYGPPIAPLPAGAA